MSLISPLSLHLFRVSASYRLAGDGEVMFDQRLEGRTRSEVGRHQQSYQAIPGVGDECDLSADAIVFGARVLRPRLAELFSRFAPAVGNQIAPAVAAISGLGINLEFQAVIGAGAGVPIDPLGLYLRVLDSEGAILVGTRRGQAHPRWPALSKVANPDGALELRLADNFPPLAESFFDEIDALLTQLGQECAAAPKVA